jgi:plastocyanin
VCHRQRRHAVRVPAAEVTVPSGGTVRWINDDATYHTVTSADSLTRRVPNGRFNAFLVATGATFTYTFTQPGNYPYYCKPRSEFMTGTAHVLAR